MSNTKRALELTEEVSSMIEFLEYNIKTAPATWTNEFCRWAIDSHSTYICDKLGVDYKDFDELLQLQRDYEFEAIQNYEEPNDYIGIAKVMFAYYHHLYKREMVAA
jgi:hypothetical protein